MTKSGAAEKGKKSAHTKQQKQEKSREKIDRKILKLESKLQALKNSVSGDSKLEEKATFLYAGVELRCNRDAHVRVGPVIGKVTATSAIVLLEVTLTTHVTCHLIPEGAQSIISQKSTLLLHRNRPRSFLVENLQPNTRYTVVFEGINKKDAIKRTGRVHTLASEITQMRVVALSCDRPERLKPGETNMWEELSKQTNADEVDIILHLGDQVYGQDEFIDAQAILRYAHLSEKPTTPEEVREVRRLHKLIKDRMRDSYRYTWNLPFTQMVLSQSSHLMIWSDNDLYNDFTIAKEDGKSLEPVMIKLGQEVYREYQRQLWDPIYYDENTHTDEFHYHQYGHVGILMIDMRGNRVDVHGNQQASNPFVNDAQWEVINSALTDPQLRTLFVCSEIPFAGDPPATVKANSQKKGMEFLVDHWAYNEHELIKLFEMVFNWKHAGAGKRDAIFVAGDIHVGVDSLITDTQTNDTIQQLVATPISNHVCDFYPKLEGKVSDRFSFVHKPLLHCRNYAYMVASAEESQAKITGKLIAGKPTHAEH